MMHQSFTLRTSRRCELIPITSQVRDFVRQSRLNQGICLIYVPHTTAGVTINENADPDVVADLLETLEQLIPNRATYRHAEGNSDAHVKASLMGVSQTVAIVDGALVLGRWQGIFFCEFDGPRERTFTVTLTGSEARP